MPCNLDCFHQTQLQINDGLIHVSTVGDDFSETNTRVVFPEMEAVTVVSSGLRGLNVLSVIIVEPPQNYPICSPRVIT